MIRETQYRQAIDRLTRARRVLVITHINPDGDALGSLCFMIEWLSAAGVEHDAYCAGPLPPSLSFLPGIDRIITDKTSLDMSRYDVIVSLDCGSLSRTNLIEEICARAPGQYFIEIDHHLHMEAVSDLEIREPDAASTTEMLYQMALACDLALTPLMARCLLTGILTDTGNFVYSATTQRTIAAASTMLLRGANLFKIVDRTGRTKSLSDLRLWGIALSRLVINPKYNLASTVLTEADSAECGASEDAVTGIAGFVSGLPDVAAIMVLREADGMVYGNLRTTRDDINVAELARRLGGGGHRKAAGFTVPGRLVKKGAGWRLEK